jgi:hypothetical protein
MLVKIDNMKHMNLSQFKTYLIKISIEMPQQLVSEMSSCCEETRWKIWTKLIQTKFHDVLDCK